MHRLYLCIAISAVCLSLLACGGGGSGGGGVVVTSDTVVLGYNDLGMHCMNQDFSEIMILPPSNNLHAQVIRRGEEPDIVTGGATLTYAIPGNTHSADKTNFWNYEHIFFGQNLPDSVGLTGNGLSGNMVPTGDNDWVATSIPITPITDAGQEDPYQLATITVMRNGQSVASTQAVVPVSWEISCNLCHVPEPGKSTATDILEAHDEHHGTNLVNQKPVMCGSCHEQAPLGLTGEAGVPSLSRAMHNSHSGRMGQAGLDVACYACHPGVRTKCQRDVHFSKGMDCVDCHGEMMQVASTGRRPWVDEPKCGGCHTRQGFEFEETGKLFKDSKGHHGVHCAACHGSPHAVLPSVVGADNVQVIALQGSAGTLSKCTVCHTQQPDDGFEHRVD